MAGQIERRASIAGASASKRCLNGVCRRPSSPPATRVQRRDRRLDRRRVSRAGSHRLADATPTGRPCPAMHATRPSARPECRPASISPVRPSRPCHGSIAKSVRRGLTAPARPSASGRLPAGLHMAQCRPRWPADGGNRAATMSRGDEAGSANCTGWVLCSRKPVRQHHRAKLHPAVQQPGPGQVLHHMAAEAADRTFLDRDQHLVVAGQLLDQPPCRAAWRTVHPPPWSTGPAPPARPPPAAHRPGACRATGSRRC